MKPNPFFAYSQVKKAQAARELSRPDFNITTEYFPRIDKPLIAVRDALWDAWLIGLEQSGYNVERHNPTPEREEWEPEIN